MERTKIAWTATVLPDGTVMPGYTFNPWMGCTKVSPGSPAGSGVVKVFLKTVPTVHRSFRFLSSSSK
ncbi:hypothetical protein AYO44_13540 [Planctomycetaceae bacterium SCGC AG-212-F19]|nr:hypothetical protein AYO44_13540 [Planctomycetaceae bacterium SCGC AG-212-F19]